MDILIVADDESLVNRMPEIKADVLISCGDLHESVILRAIERSGCRHALAVKGNHDGAGRFPLPIIDLHLQTCEIDGVTFGGFAGSWKYKPRGHHLFEQEEVEAALFGFAPVDVFVAHNSPRGIHDREDEVHHGFTAFNAYIARTNPKLLLHGHQHLEVESMVGSTRVIGSYGYRLITL